MIHKPFKEVQSMLAQHFNTMHSFVIVEAHNIIEHEMGRPSSCNVYVYRSINE